MEKPSVNKPEAQVKTLQIGYNASGAAVAGKKGDVVVIVDVIDMSTTAEACLDGGALGVFGAAPDGVKPPVVVNPKEMGYLAGKLAVEHSTDVIIIAEPRWGTEAERLMKVQSALAGITLAGAKFAHILPNIGGEVQKLADFTKKVVLIVSDTGGVAFDAAQTNGAVEVLTATVARTRSKKGASPMLAAAERAIKAALRHKTGITFIAASANSYEDIFAAEALARKVIELGFLG